MFYLEILKTVMYTVSWNFDYQVSNYANYYKLVLLLSDYNLYFIITMY